MVTRHTYASVDELRDYLVGTSYASGWTSDAAILRRIVESATQSIDQYVGMQSFGPRTETRSYDIGTGSLRDSHQTFQRSMSGTIVNPIDSLRQAIPLGAWLISTTTVTSYKQTARTESETLAEGYGNDYLLEPYNTSPKQVLKLNEDTTKGFYGGQQTFTILGQWGYSNETESVTTLDGALNSSATSFDVASASGLSVAQTILVDTEQMYITAISSNTLTVEREVNGTTAASHLTAAGVSKYLYAYGVAQACLDLGKLKFRDRDQGATDILGSGTEGVTRANESMKSVLKTLDPYRMAATYESVVF